MGRVPFPLWKFCTIYVVETRVAMAARRLITILSLTQKKHCIY